jgi:hypothetical protein
MFLTLSVILYIPVFLLCIGEIRKGIDAQRAKSNLPMQERRYAHARESQESGKHWASSRAFSLKAPGMRRDRRLLTKLVRKAYSLQST